MMGTIWEPQYPIEDDPEESLTAAGACQEMPSQTT
jgi:hypothetical protein